MKKRDPFLEQLKRRQEAAASNPQTSASSAGKHMSEMSLEELEAEERRLQWETTKAEIERLQEKRAAQAATSSNLGPRAFVPRKQVFSFPRRRRPGWK
jgi:hypothetical protein